VSMATFTQGNQRKATDFEGTSNRHALLLLQPSQHGACNVSHFILPGVPQLMRKGNEHFPTVSTVLHWIEYNGSLDE